MTSILRSVLTEAWKQIEPDVGGAFPGPFAVVGRAP